MRIATIASLSGIVIGLMSFLFQKAIDQALPFLGGKWWAIWIPVVVIIIFKAGSDFSEIIDDIHLRLNKIPVLRMLIDLIYSFACVACGLPVGVESIGVTMSLSFSKYLEKGLKLNSDKYRILSVSCVAAGISSFLGTPLGAAVFLYENVGEISFMPILLSSIMANAANTIVSKDINASLGAGTFTFKEFIVSIAVAVILGFLSYPIRKIFFRGISSSSSLEKKNFYLPIIFGGICLSIGVYTFPESFNGIWGLFDQLIYGKGLNVNYYLSITVIMISLIMIFAVLRTIGVILPLITVGGAIGVFIATKLGLPTGVIAVCGSSAFVASLLGAPVSAALFSVEITNNMLFVVPALLASYISYKIAQKLDKSFLINYFLEREGYFLVHGKCRNTLSKIKARNAIRQIPKITSDTDLMAVIHEVDVNKFSVLPVCTRDNDFVGFITIDDIAPYTSISRAELEKIANIVHASDICKKPDRTLHELDTLDLVIDLISEPGFVVVLDNNEKYMGVVFTEDLLLIYKQYLKKKIIRKEYGELSTGAK